MGVSDNGKKSVFKRLIIENIIIISLPVILITAVMCMIVTGIPKISELSGFGDESYFCRYFKKMRVNPKFCVNSLQDLQNDV